MIVKCLSRLSFLGKRDVGTADEAHTSGIEHDRKIIFFPFLVEVIVGFCFEYVSALTFVNLELYFNLKVEKMF